MYTPATNALFFRPASHEDLERITILEETGYPADEAASRESLRFRLSEASKAFMVAIQQGLQSGDDAEGSSSMGADEVVGFICGTLTTAERLTHHSMQHHEKNGHTLCIHSVCVDKSQRRKGIASRMLKGYMLMIQNMLPELTTARLICKKDLIGLYSAAGFEMVGPSDVEHGKDPWYEMKLHLPTE